MAQNPPTGVVCSAGVVEACGGSMLLFSLSNTITSYGDRYPEGRTEESNSRSKQIGPRTFLPFKKNGGVTDRAPISEDISC